MDTHEFEKIIAESARPLVIDFWAPWCAPCRATRPILEKLAAEYRGQVVFLEINADESGELLRARGILGIPTVLAYQNGAETGRVTGARDEAGYRALFAALAEGRAVKIPLRSFDRALRLGAGGLLLAIALQTHSLPLAALGGLVAFLGIYDRCPVWAALTRALRRGS